MASWFIVICTVLCVCGFADSNTESVVRYSQNNATTPYGKILACYYTPSRRMPVSSVPSNLCTHLIYGFGVMTPKGIIPNSPSDVRDYRILVNLKKVNPSLKVMISIQKNFSSVVDQGTEALWSFSKSAVKFLLSHNFDGVDLDWEYPKASQREAFSNFIMIFKFEIRQSNLLLSLALPNSPEIFNRGYDAPSLMGSVDFMTVMAYDFHMFIKNKDNTTGYSSPLYAPDGERETLSTLGMINFYTSQGLNYRNLLLGIPTYGRSWTLADPERSELHSPAVGNGQPAPYSGLNGLYIYSDICVAKQKGATTVQDRKYMAEYLHHDTAWVTFDSMFTIKAKITIIREAYDLSGVSVWALHTDDPEDVCKKGPFPLTNAIRANL